LKERAAHELNLGANKSFNVVLYEKQREKYTLTDIHDVSKKLNFKVSEKVRAEKPLRDRGINVVP